MSNDQDPRPDPSSVDDELLHRLHDGELAAAERDRVTASLDDTGREKLAALGELSGAMQAMYGGEATVGFDAWPAVERQISRGNVISLTDRLRRRAPVWISSLAVAAAALAVFLVLPPRDVASPNDCIIDELDVTGASATILKVDEDKHGGGTTVLWLEE